MPEPYSILATSVTLVLVVAAVAGRLAHRLTGRTACGLCTLASVIAAVRTYLTQDWPWDLTMLLATAVLLLTWTTFPTKREKESRP
jgi:Na+/melibiose symporter-like transporter